MSSRVLTKQQGVTIEATGILWAVLYCMNRGGTHGMTGRLTGLKAIGNVQHLLAGRNASGRDIWAARDESI